MDVCNPWDLMQSCGRAIRWMFGGRKRGSGKDVYIELQDETRKTVADDLPEATSIEEAESFSNRMLP